MDKLKMHSLNKVDANIAKIGALFPNCLTERKNSDGEVAYAIDFDQLRQELSSVIVEGAEERYQFTWPDKRKSILLANAPIAKTLRPCREESVDFDTTENLYIEGDNLDVLKLLQETYLGKIKMIYIDPPYNTGNDFVYNDDFAEDADTYLANSGQFDAEGNRLVQNTESNGRFHTDWLNMMYMRLKLAKDLLSDDGVIFISIDDNELDNLIRICKDVFGEQNYEACVAWRRRTNQPNDKSKMIAKVSENIVVFAKNSVILSEKKAFHGVPLSEDRKNEYKNPDNDPRGPWSTNPWKAAVGRGGTRYSITTPTGKTYTETWYGNEKTFSQLNDEGRVYWTDNGNGYPRIKIYLCDAERDGQAAINFFTHERFGSNQEGSSELEKLFDRKGLFDNPKPTRLLKSLALLATSNDSIILDFFSGSATTAHAVMQLNAEDGGNRKFIMVQLPEETDAKSEAYKAGYKNICEIGKERIRRAGRKILTELASGCGRVDGTGYGMGIDNVKEYEKATGEKVLDIGFRVLKLDSSNMKDVYYSPADYEISMFDNLADNIKDDRTPEDLLFQVMLDLGVLLSSKIEESTIAGKKVFNVADGFLMACFDENVSDETITAVAKQQPYYFVMRDSSLANDSTATNFDQIFAAYSPDTVRKVL